MNLDQLTTVANAFVSGIPSQVTDQLEDVEILMYESPELAQADLDQLLEPVEGEPLVIPADCKGVFIGEPMEVEDSDDTEQEEVELLPDGIIALIASNLATAEEVGLVLMHEMGHALGMDEDEVKALGLGVEPSVTKTPETAPTSPEATPDAAPEANRE